jgi:P2 family phage contractile tail tube protein
MPVYPYAVKVYKAYLGADALVGLDTLTMPNINIARGTVSGSGITATEQALPIPGVLQGTMEASFAFHTSTDDAFKLFDGTRKTLTVYTDQLHSDSSSGALLEIPEKVIMMAYGTGFNLGTRSNSTKANVVLAVVISYLSLYYRGVALWQIDPQNAVCILNGVDQNAVARGIIG